MQNYYRLVGKTLVNLSEVMMMVVVMIMMMIM